MLFDTVETVVELMRRARTTTGLRTTVHVIRRLYDTGRNATDQMKHELRIRYDDFLATWNYVATLYIRHLFPARSLRLGGVAELDLGEPVAVVV